MVDSLIVTGGMLGQLGRTAEAEPVLEEAAAMARRVLGDGHPMLRSAREALAVASWRAGKLEKSIPLFESLLAERRKELPAGDVDVLAAAANLGINYKDAGRFAEAIPLLEEAVRGAGRVPELGFVRMPLLEAYAGGADAARPGEAARVAALVKQLLPEVRAEQPEKGVELAGVLAQAGRALMMVKAWEEAEPVLRECLAIREAEQPEAWTTFNTASMLGGVLLGKGRAAEAEALLLKGYEGMKAREGAMPEGARARLVQAVDRLVEVSAALGKAGEEKRWREERGKYPGAGK